MLERTVLLYVMYHISQGIWKRCTWPLSRVVFSSAQDEKKSPLIATSGTKHRQKGAKTAHFEGKLSNFNSCYYSNQL
jgi:hypothetical protein